jgi:putative DNA primase/helicase
MRVGIPGEYLDGNHHGCPICGDGRNSHRFRFDNKNGEGTWICNQCGAGYGLRLIERYCNCSTAVAMNKIEQIVDSIPVVPLPLTVDNSFDPRPALNKLWLLSDHLTGSDMVSCYLHSRGLVMTPLNIRYSTSCYEPDAGKRMDAMIARIQNVNGKPIGLHRIYLENNRKAHIPVPKKIMPATEPLQGCSIRLFSSRDRLFKDGVLGVAEGIETAIAASHLFGVATWACLSSTLMPSWLPPLQIRKIIIFGDNDDNYAGQEAAYRLGHILHRKRIIVSVKIPDEMGDWADVWLKLVIKRRQVK